MSGVEVGRGGSAGASRCGVLPTAGPSTADPSTANRAAIEANLIRRACFDPGAFLARRREPCDWGPDDLEPLHAWQARAVVAALGLDSVPANRPPA